MSLTKESDTEWLLTIPVGSSNELVEVIATKEGIDVGGGVISWRDVFDARALVFPNKERLIIDIKSAKDERYEFLLNEFRKAHGASINQAGFSGAALAARVREIGQARFPFGYIMVSYDLQDGPIVLEAA